MRGRRSPTRATPTSRAHGLLMDCGRSDVPSGYGAVTVGRWGSSMAASLPEPERRSDALFYTDRYINGASVRQRLLYRAVE